MKNLILAAATMIFSSTLFASDSFRSEYQIQESVQYYISLDSENLTGRFSINFNSCGLDDYGNLTFCTELAPASYEIALIKVSEKGSQTLYRFFAAEGGERIKDYRVVLTFEGDSVDTARLLKLGSNGQVSSAYTLSHR